MNTHGRTHDPDATSWVESANEADSPFPIQNLPFCVFSRTKEEPPVVGVGIGDSILDLAAAHDLFDLGNAGVAARQPALNGIMALASESWTALRERVFDLLSADGEDGSKARDARDTLLVSQRAATLHLPAMIGDYTDFYASIHHATNVGSMFRPDNPLLPNYKWVPIGYHGRASSIVVSGTDVTRPSGQRKRPDEDAPTVGPSRQLDYELEVGAFVGGGNVLGSPIPLARIDEYLFGLCLVNDWSARDLQAWEYQPLGPFLAKNFATTIGAWVVTRDALAPFRIPAFARPDGDPAPLPYLDDRENRAQGGFSLTLEVFLTTRAMRDASRPPHRLSHGDFSGMYWTIGQMLAHHASSGCNLRPGDLIASGTVSGTEHDSRGCLLELTWRGRDAIELPGGETRTFLEDGDEITIRGWAEADGARRIGLGECRGTIAG